MAVFVISNATGGFAIDEIVDYDQTDLCTDDVMLLDTGFHIYLWVGDGASSEEKSSSFPYAHEYIKDHKRPPVMPVTRVTEGKESPKFTEFIGPAVAAQGCCVIC